MKLLQRNQRKKPTHITKALMSIKCDLGEPDRLGGLQCESKKHLQIAPSLTGMFRKKEVSGDWQLISNPISTASH